MDYKIVYKDNSLEHFGILGMKWGKRNGPPYPLDYNAHSPMEKKKNTKSRLNNYENNNPKNQKNNAIQKKSKEKHSIKSNLNNKENKSKNSFYNNLYNSYKKEGHSDEAAKKLTDTYMKMLKTIAIIGGVTVASMAAYSVYKYGRSKAFDIIGEKGTEILKGKTLQRITADPNDIELMERFYASTDKVDNMKYKGMLGFSRMLAPLDETKKDVYKVTMKAVKDIKVASENEAKMVFNQIQKKYDLKQAIGGTFNNPILNALVKDQTPKVSMDYSTFNHALVAKNIDQVKQILNTNDDKMAKKYLDAVTDFYSTMKSKGFDAILDANDRYMSGYNAKAPLIVFNKDAVASNIVKKVGKFEAIGNIIGNDVYERGYNYAFNMGMISTAAVASKAGKEQQKIIDEDKKKEKTR